MVSDLPGSANGNEHWASATVRPALATATVVTPTVRPGVLTGATVRPAPVGVVNGMGSCTHQVAERGTEHC